KCLHKKCGQVKMQKDAIIFSKTIRDSNICESRDQHISNCDKLHNCHSCHTEHNCSWQRDRKCSLMINGSPESWPVEGSKAKKSDKLLSDEEPRATCEAPCHMR